MTAISSRNRKRNQHYVSRAPRPPGRPQAPPGRPRPWRQVLDRKRKQKTGFPRAFQTSPVSRLDLLEYQSKGLLEDYGVTVQKFKMASNKVHLLHLHMIPCSPTPAPCSAAPLLRCS